jgi:GNAT superfamily N-acetyltransferase
VSLTIAPAQPDDAGLVLELIRELAAYEKLEDDVTATEDGLRSALFGPSPAAEVRLARWDGSPAGFALFFPNFSTFLGRPGLYLEDLYVKPEHRGRGIGRALLRELAVIARDRGYGRIDWWVLDWNAPAIGFYRRLGAEAMSDWTVFRLSGEALARLAD